MRAGGRTRGDDALRARERGRDFCNAHNANSFPSRCSLFLLPSAKFIVVFTGLFLVMDSSRSAGVQDVRATESHGGFFLLLPSCCFFFGFVSRRIVKIPQELNLYKFALLPVEKREESLQASSHIFF